MYAKCLVLYPGDTIECYPFNTTLCRADSFQVLRSQITLFVQTNPAFPVANEFISHFLDGSPAHTPNGLLNVGGGGVTMSVWWCNETTPSAMAWKKRDQTRRGCDDGDNGAASGTMNGVFNELATRLLAARLRVASHTEMYKVYGPAIVSAYRPMQGGGQFVNIDPEWLLKPPPPPPAQQLQQARLVEGLASGSQLPKLPHMQEQQESRLPSLSHNNTGEVESNNSSRLPFVHTLRTWPLPPSLLSEAEQTDLKSMGSFLSANNNHEEKAMEAAAAAGDGECVLITVTIDPREDSGDDNRDKKREREQQQQPPEATATVGVAAAVELDPAQEDMGPDAEEVAAPVPVQAQAQGPAPLTTLIQPPPPLPVVDLDDTVANGPAPAAAKEEEEEEGEDNRGGKRSRRSKRQTSKKSAHPSQPQEKFVREALAAAEKATATAGTYNLRRRK